MPRGLTASLCTVTVGQVQRMVDGLAAETGLPRPTEIAPDAVPAFATWARPERPD